MADGSVRSDPLEQDLSPERVNYAIGVQLDAQDFLAEQTYHRAQLARMLRYLAGMGTLAGLRVSPPATGDAELTLRVEPGLAIDRLGRLIEIRVAQCIRLARWFADQTPDALRAALHRAPAVPVDAAVVADVFLSWHAAPRGKTPAFVAGPFAALDAVVPARLADAHELRLVLRKESTAPAPGGTDPTPLPSPNNFWPDPAGIADAAERRRQMLQAVLGSWHEGTAFRTGESLDPLREHVEGEDPTAVLLARVTIPAALDPAAPSGTMPALRADQPVGIDNSLRPFVFLPGKWLGEAFTAGPLTLP